jgi:glyoxylase-like metal-dependent hydrolase (beta-lactamase superfamily II)
VRKLVVIPIVIVFVSCATPIARREIPLQAPPSTTKNEVSVCFVEYAQGFGFTAAGLVIKHPKGIVLVDAGESMHFDDEVGGRVYERSIAGPLVPQKPAAQVLREQAGVDAHELAMVIPTHVHSDHLGGIMDLPPVSVRLAPDERAHLERGVSDDAPFNVFAAEAKKIVPHVDAIDFADKPFEIFARSWDVFGDGAVVVVPLPGHTPGSVGVFVQAGTTRLVDVGDALNNVSQLDGPEGKGALLRATDFDVARANATVAILAALHKDDPALVILPGHERATWFATFDHPGACLPR